MIQKRESIIKKRKDNALTQQAVADRAGISRSYYAMVEAGHRVPTLKTWLKIGEAIHIPKQEIIKMIFSQIKKSKNYAKSLVAILILSFI